MMYSAIVTRLLVAAIALSLIAGCSKKSFRQNSSSMEPTIKSGDVVSVDLSAYSGLPPKRWDVIAFESPIAGGEQWISRVVGFPGETIDIRGGKILIDGSEEKRPARLRIGNYTIPKSDLAASSNRPVVFPFTIPASNFFVLGDNVSDALDSRFWGGLDDSKILGKIHGK